jgi:hypothetical protein
MNTLRRLWRKITRRRPRVHEGWREHPEIPRFGGDPADTQEAP